MNKRCTGSNDWWIAVWPVLSLALIVTACAGSPEAVLDVRPVHATSEVLAPEPTEDPAPGEDLDVDPAPEPGEDDTGDYVVVAPTSVPQPEDPEPVDAPSLDLPRAIRYGMVEVDVVSASVGADGTRMVISATAPAGVNASFPSNVLTLVDASGNPHTLDLVDGGSSIRLTGGEPSRAEFVTALDDVSGASLKISGGGDAAVLPLSGVFESPGRVIYAVDAQSSFVVDRCPEGALVDVVARRVELTLNRDAMAGVLSLGLGRAGKGQQVAIIDVEATQRSECPSRVTVYPSDAAVDGSASGIRFGAWELEPDAAVEATITVAVALDATMLELTVGEGDALRIPINGPAGEERYRSSGAGIGAGVDGNAASIPSPTLPSPSLPRPELPNPDLPNPTLPRAEFPNPRFPEAVVLPEFGAPGITAHQTDEATVFTFDAEVLFDFDADELRPDADRALSAFLEVLGQIDGVTTLEIGGHTDSIGSDEYNDDLSRRRAEAVAEWLLGADVDVAMAIEGFGERFPVAPNTKADGADDPDARQLNRRVEIVAR